MASQMSDAEIERTTVEIGYQGQKQNFNTIGEVIKFDGFLKLYKLQTSDDKSDEPTVPNYFNRPFRLISFR